MRKNECEHSDLFPIIHDFVLLPTREFDSYGRLVEVDDFEARTSKKTKKSVSFEGKPQESPEDLQARGEGSVQFSVCRKI